MDDHFRLKTTFTPDTKVFVITLSELERVGNLQKKKEEGEREERSERGSSYVPSWKCVKFAF